MKKHSKHQAVAVALSLFFATAASAGNPYQLQLKEKKFAEVEQAANAKLAREPGNVDAMIARTDAIMGLEDDRLDEAVKQAEKCVAAHPKEGRCHLALGQSLGIKAMQSGLAGAMGSIGTIRDSLKKAVELNPRDFEARFSLLDFYMMAPFLVGGGMGKAETLAEDSAALNAEGSKLMFALIDLSENRQSKAEAAALSLKPGNDDALLERHENLLISFTAQHLKAKRFSDAERMLREALKRYPDSAAVTYFGGRLQQEQGKHREALGEFEKALLKNPRSYIHYRIAKSLQALGEKAKAVAAFEKALSFKNLPPPMRTDGDSQLKVLR